jgi:hypothetical protein
VIAAAIPDAMLLPTDEWFAQEVSDLIYIYIFSYANGVSVVMVAW